MVPLISRNELSDNVSYQNELKKKNEKQAIDMVNEKIEQKLKNSRDFEGD